MKSIFLISLGSLLGSVFASISVSSWPSRVDGTCQKFTEAIRRADWTTLDGMKHDFFCCFSNDEIMDAIMNGYLQRDNDLDRLLKMFPLLKRNQKMIDYLLDNYCGTFEEAQKYFEPESRVVIDVIDQLYTRFRAETGFLEYTWEALKAHQTNNIALIYAIILESQYRQGVDISGLMQQHSFDFPHNPLLPAYLVELSLIKSIPILLKKALEAFSYQRWKVEALNRSHSLNGSMGNIIVCGSFDSEDAREILQILHQNGLDFNAPTFTPNGSSTLIVFLWQKGQESVRQFIRESPQIWSEDHLNLAQREAELLQDSGLQALCQEIMASKTV